MNELIEKYLKRGFGSMNKNDFEVAIFHEIMKEKEFVNKNDYELSRELRITKAKVAELRYKADLYYGKDSNNEDEYKEKFKKILEKAKIQSTEKVLFAIPDKAMRLYLENLLTKDNRFCDTSFNASMVSIYIDDLAYLINNVYKEDDLKKFVADVESTKPELVQSIKEEIHNIDDAKFKPTMVDVVKNVIKKAVNSGIGQTAVSSVINFTLDNLLKFCI